MEKLMPLFCLGTLLAGFTGVSTAQDFSPWQALETPYSLFQPGRLYGSDNLDMLVYCGNFQIEPGQTFMAGFDGLDWDTLTTKSTFTSLTYCMDYSDGMLMSATNTTCEDNTDMLTVMSYYDEGEVELCRWEFNGSIHRLRWINDTLYAVGWFTEVDGESVYRVARLEGETWHGLIPNEDEVNGSIHNIVHFDNKFFVGGKFVSDNGAHTFAYIEDGQLQNPPSNVTGIWAAVSYMEVFNNELYLGGSIPYVEGNVSNHLVKFDGEQIMPVPGMLKDRDGNLTLMGSLAGMMQRDDYLYIHGDFGYIDDVPISGIARWNGSQWCGLHTDGFDQNIRSIAFFDSNLYAFVPFTFVSDTIPKLIWRLNDYEIVSNCTEPLSAGQEAPADMLTLHPNPAHTHAALTSAQHPLERLALYDLQGRVVHEARPAGLTYRIPLTGLPAGMYVVSVQVGGEVVRMKLVVE